MRKDIVIKDYPSGGPPSNMGEAPIQSEGTLVLGAWILDRMNLKWWISAGTLLGIHRDGRLIPHDTDIDVEILADWTESFDKQIEDELFFNFQFMGFDLYRTMHQDDEHGNEVSQLAFVHRETNIVFDIYFFYRKPTTKILINENDMGQLWYPPINDLTLTAIKFSNYTFPCFDPDWYCEFRYGQGWRTPSKVKKGWAADAHNLKVITK